MKYFNVILIPQKKTHQHFYSIILLTLFCCRYLFVFILLIYLLVFTYFTYLLVFIYLFTYFERTHEHKRGTERKTENPKQTPCCQRIACCGLNLKNYKIMT